jgi:acyl-coenzyme A thioesterase PaaI-like protein
MTDYLVTSKTNSDQIFSLAAEPGAMAGLLETAQRAVFDGTLKLNCVSQSIEFTAPAEVGVKVITEAQIDRATRSLLFVQSRVLRLKDRTVLATGAGVYQIITL